MNIVLYGISEELAQRTAMHYGFALCRPFETGTEEENRFWLQPRLENEEELLAFIERMAQHDEQIAAVVAAPTEASTETPMGDFNAVLYATRTDKLFTLGTATGGAVNNAVSDQTPEYELARIIETQLRNAAGTRLRPRRALKEFFVRRAPHPVFRRGEGRPPR